MWKKLLTLVLLTVAWPAMAGNNGVMAENAWLRESVKGQTTASMQLRLTALRPATLLKVSTPFARSVQIQRIWPRPGGTRVHVLHYLRLPTGRTVSFGEHSLALMLVGLKTQLSAKERIPVTLTVRLAGGHVDKLKIEAEVRPLELSYRHYQSEDVYDH